MLVAVVEDYLILAPWEFSGPHKTVVAHHAQQLYHVQQHTQQLHAHQLYHVQQHLQNIVLVQQNVMLNFLYIKLLKCICNFSNVKWRKQSAKTVMYEYFVFVGVTYTVCVTQRTSH